jgi:transcriptional regulator with XRE-family HTH domain
MSPSDIETLVWMRDASKTGELRRIRLESDLSLEDVASVGPVHITTVWKWEKGERRVTTSDAALRVGKMLRKLQRELESA